MPKHFEEVDNAVPGRQLLVRTVAFRLLRVTQHAGGSVEHPGRRIEERFMEPLGITASQLARALGVNRSTVSRMLAGRQPVTPAMAARLGVCFSVPARWFLLMQAEFDADQIAADTTVTAGVTPIEIDADWMLTPDGAISLVAPDVPAVEVPVVRTVRLDNGAMALLSEAS